MKQEERQKGRTVNLLFTMLLFLVFVLCALFMVLIGGRVYENINRRGQENDSVQIVLNYVANKVRQGDREGSIRVREIDGTSVLELGQVINDSRYLTWIYCRDGMVRELFTNEDSGLGLADGLEIVKCEELFFEQDASLLEIRTKEAGLFIHIRSGGGQNEE